ncbi:MAG: response regulator transcription factor, partial [Spirochaetaceae bacterium]|nr:response regulator transcription factor [Spirochaetaceae bacterium]
MQGKILIIEDEKELSDIVSFYLAKEGFEVRAVESAEDAIALLENGAVGAPKSGAGQNGAGSAPKSGGAGQNGAGGATKSGAGQSGAGGATKSGAGQSGAWKPELIILDINLPGMDGFEFLQRLRRGDITPVIVVSARDSDEDLICGFSGGADEFVTKPFSP